MLFIIIPAYNEEANIGRVIRDLFSHSEGFKQIIHPPAEGFKQIKIVVVDDGSSDKTAEIAASEGATVIQHPINRGQGAALQTGNEYALQNGAEIVVHFDADGQFNPADIAPALQTFLAQDLDLVLGSRFLGREATNMPKSKRWFLLNIGRRLNNLFTGVALTDAHNGFRVIHRRALIKMRIEQDGMAHASEIVSHIKQHDLKFIEHPIEVTYHEFGQGMGGALKIIRDLVISKIV